MTESDKAALVNAETGSPSKLESFSPEELIVCEACLRANPPTRARCLYCGAQLQTVDERVNPVQTTAPESTSQQSGPCLVLLPDRAQEISEDRISEIASLLQLKPTELRTAIGAGGPLPLFSASSADDANSVGEQIRALGLQTITVPGEAFTSTAAPRKIRGLELSEDSLTAIPPNPDEQASLWNDFFLIVEGRLITSRTEVEEKGRRRSQPDDSRPLLNDEGVMDLYPKSIEGPWRIFGNTFDFSCLGSEKRITAFENSRALINLFRERAPGIEIDSSYHRKRLLLANVWPLETKSSKRELRRNAGKFGLSTVTTTDNESQFDKYSRLLCYLALSEKNTGA
jgi:hypothetical protein